MRIKETIRRPFLLTLVLSLVLAEGCIQVASPADTSPDPCLFLTNTECLQAGDPLPLALQCARTAAERGDLATAAQAYAAAGSILGQQGKGQQALETLRKATNLARQGPETSDKARLLIEIGVAYCRIATADPASPPALAAVSTLQEARRLAESLHDPLLLSAALGHMGEIYEEADRPDEALQLARQAVFAAQEASEPRLLYQWQWQTGRLLNKRGDREGALTAYRMAIAESRSIREMSGTPCQEAGNAPSSSRPLSALYEEAVDLLLQKAAARQQTPEVRSACLREARESVELLKAAELRDYFQDDCLASLQAKKTDIDAISPRTAIIYPIILADRIEILTSIGGVMNSHRITQPVPEVNAEIKRLRSLLETRTSSEYLPPAQHLYDLLIRPLEAELQAAGVDTLVIVPSGAFRTIPFDALHNGTSFLVARYATAVTPGLDLTEPRPLAQEAVTALAAGLTKAVQGFPPLPHVEQEIREFHAAYGGRQLVNEEFQVAALELALRQEPIGIIHIASHGHFGHELANTFLLAYDQKLTMDRLHEFVGMFRFRKEPLELLTLSACQTAAGDDRAALGLAGVAVRAGARSAVATLWYINDQASSTLIEEFYRHLQQAGTTRAGALQQAKVALMQDRRYRHPAYWAPFLLINNWL